MMVAGIDLSTLDGREQAERRAQRLEVLAADERDQWPRPSAARHRASAFEAEAKMLREGLRAYYATSKYGSVLAEQADAVVGDGFAEDQYGSVDEAGHYALVYVDAAPIEERWVIVGTTSMGFVDVYASSDNHASILCQWDEVTREDEAEQDEDEQLVPMFEPAGRRAYVVQGHIAPGGRQLPTFYLLADVQGITSVEAAERVARDIVEAGWDIGPTVSRTVILSVAETVL